MSALFDIIKGTPWWVFALFIYLLLQGIKALQFRVMPLKKLFVLPLAFTAWSLYSLATFKLCVICDIIIWATAAILGSFLGWKLAGTIKIEADKKKALIALPGGASTLVLSLLIFMTKYCFGFYYATHTDVNPLVHDADLVTSGVIIGLFLGRAICYLKKFLAAEHTELSTDCEAG